MTDYDDSRSLYSVELEFISKAVEWAAHAPENEFFYISEVVLQDCDGAVIGKVVTGDELRFIPVKKELS